MNKFFLPIIVLVVVVGAVLAGVFLSQQDKTEPVTLKGSGIESSERIKGSESAKVELVEYGDFQCPACAAFDPIVNKLMQENGDWVKFTYRHFPLKSIHPNAEEGAWAAEAAGKQGKFWEMKDVLYARQTEWATLPDPAGKFADFATELGLSFEQFVADYDSDELHAKVETDFQTAESIGVNSTPTFFVNGTKISNPTSYEAFVETLRNAQQ